MKLRKQADREAALLNAQVLGESAMVTAARNEPALARERFDQAVRQGESLVADSPNRIDFLAVLSSSLKHAGEQIEATGEREEACKYQQRRLEVWKRWNVANTQSAYSLGQERLAEAATETCSPPR